MLKSASVFYKFTWLLIIVSWSWIIIKINGGLSNLVTCPFKSITGLPCPGCGLTTGVLSHISGDHYSGFMSHPLALIILIALIGVTILLVIDLLRKKENLFKIYNSFESLLKNKWVFFLFIMIIIAIWMYNIISKK